MPADNAKKLKFLLKNIMTAVENEADCGECFDHLDEFVELVDAGKDASSLLPRIEAHLDHCHCCHEEYEMLLSMVRGNAPSEGEA